VKAAAERLAVVAVGGWYLISQPDSSAEDFFVLISITMTGYGLVTATVVYLGAWTKGLD